MNSIAIVILSGFLIFLGILGAVLPLLPGPPIALAGLILLGIVSDWQKVSPTAAIVFASLTLLTFLFDFIAPALGAKGYKSTSYGVVGAIIGAILGIVVLGPLGAFVGPFAGALLGELLGARAQMDTALKSAWGAFVGFLVSALFKLTVTLAMAAYFIFALFK